MKPNAIRDKALTKCADQEAARAAWSRVYEARPEFSGTNARYVERKEVTAARLAMLSVLAGGGTIEAAEAAGMKHWEGLSA